MKECHIFFVKCALPTTSDSPWVVATHKSQPIADNQLFGGIIYQNFAMHLEILGVDLLYFNTMIQVKIFIWPFGRWYLKHVSMLSCARKNALIHIMLWNNTYSLFISGIQLTKRDVRFHWEQIYNTRKWV